MTKSTTTTTVTIDDYTAYKAVIDNVMTYTGTTPLVTGAVIDPSQTTLAMTINGQPGRKLRASDQVKAGSVVYEYHTKADKLKGTVSRYATLDAIVDKDVAKQYKQLISDISTKLLNGDISADQAMTAVEDLKKAQAQL